MKLWPLIRAIVAGTLLSFAIKELGWTVLALWFAVGLVTWSDKS